MLNLMIEINMYTRRIEGSNLLRGWGAQGFSTPKLSFPPWTSASPHRNSTTLWEDATVSPRGKLRIYNTVHPQRVVPLFTAQ